MIHKFTSSRSFISILIIILASLSTSICLAQVQKIDVHVAWPDNNFHTQGVHEFAKSVAAKTNNQVQLIVHSGGSLGLKGQEVLRSVRQGAVPMAEVFMGNIEGDNPIFGLSSLPLMAKDFDSAKALYSKSKALYQKACEKAGTVFLYATPWPPSGIFTKKPINTLEDLKGLKIRTYDANSATFIQALGAKGIALPFSELYTALSTGLVKGVLTSSVTGVDAKLWEVTKSFLQINYAYPLNMMTMQRAAFDKLSVDQKYALMQAATEIESAQWLKVEKEDQESLKALAKNNIKINAKVGPKIQQLMEKTAAAMRNEWLKKIDANERQTLEVISH